jgi:membrane protease YdiL (CAAX protease family)
VAARSRTLLALCALAALPAPWLASLATRGAAPVEAALWQLLTGQLSFGALAVLVGLALGGPLRERLGLVRGRLGPGQLALGALGTLALSGALQFAVDALGLTPGSALEQLSDLASRGGPAEPLLALATFALAPALAEELLCRGVLQRSLERVLGRLSIPAAAVAFAALHLDPVHASAAFVLGCYLGALAWLGGTTWLPIACHFANNLAATLSQGFPAIGAALPRPQAWGDAAVWLFVASAALALTARFARLSRTGCGRPSD